MLCTNYNIEQTITCKNSCINYILHVNVVHIVLCPENDSTKYKMRTKCDYNLNKRNMIIYFDRTMAFYTFISVIL